MRPDDLEQLRYEVDGGVARLRLQRPERGNSFTSRVYDEIRWAIRWAGLDESVDVVVISGAGRSFATGGDLSEVLERLHGEGPVGMYAFFDHLPWNDVLHCPKVVIAAVNGNCMAGGLITASACDIVVAVESARFGFPEGRVGIADAWAPALLAGKVSAAKLKYLLFTGKAIPAAEAERIGLVTEVVADGDLERRVEELITELRATSPTARRLFKRYVNGHIDIPDDPGGLPAFQSPEALEGLRAFAEGRPPAYR